MKKKHYREFFNKEYMYWFIWENRNNIKRYRFMKYYSHFNNIYYILEYVKIKENIKDITRREKILELENK